MSRDEKSENLDVLQNVGKWARKQLREMRNGPPPNSYPRGSAAPADADVPLCFCGDNAMDTVSHDLDTKGRRLWICAQKRGMKWEEDEKRKVKHMFHFCLPLLAICMFDSYEFVY